jgi:YggT family protein
MTLITIVHYLFVGYTLMLIARILGSWVPEFSRHPIMRFVQMYTDPYLNIFRRFIPPLGMIDLSPIVAFFALRLIEAYLVMPFLLMLLGYR